MPWGRIDDGLYDHPKLDALGRWKLAGIGLWTLALSWSNRRLTDGFVPADRVTALGGTKAIAEALVEAGMFDPSEGGYLIHDFLTFNESREQVEARREADRRRKRPPDGVRTEPGRKPAGVQPESNGLPKGLPARAGSRPDPSSPVLDSPSPAERGGQVNPRANGTNPRALGTNPRATATRDRKAKADGKQQVELAYYRGELTEAQKNDALRELGYTVEDPATWFDAPTPAEAPA